jgi:hypothetical protein
MSVAYQRISSADVDDIITYDPAAERRAATLKVNWDTFFRISSQEILYNLEFGWWPKYVEQTFGAWYFKSDAKGRLISSFDPQLLVKSDQTLIRLDVFRAVQEFYMSLVTDVSNVNEVDKTNYEFAVARYEREWTKAGQLSNFYNLDRDGVISKLEENMYADAAYFNNDRRYW